VPSTLIASLLLLSGSTLGCGDDPQPLFADLQWQVRCMESGGCSGLDPHDINHLDGEDGHRIACSVEDSGDARVMTWSTYKGNDYGIEIRSAVFMGNGGPVMGTGCQVTVEEAGNTYRGSCSSSVPSVDFPCQISGLMVADEDDGPTIRGNLRCEHLPATADMSRLREVTFPGADAAAPVQFRIVNCSGL